MAEWIKCSECMPDDGAICVVLAKHWSEHPTPPEIAEREGSAATGAWKRFLADDTDDDVSPYIEDTVTHWMELTLPEEDE
jgi:hypothetical protein